MKTYLSNLVDSSIEATSRGIHKISNEDAQIIFNLIYCIEQMTPSLFDVIQDWKILPDAAILENLEILVESLEKSEQKGEQKGGRTFVRFGEDWVVPEQIFSYAFVDGYDEDDDDHPNRYNILLNKTSNDKLIYANKEIVFYSPKQRDLEFKKYQDKIFTFHTINFIE